MIYIILVLAYVIFTFISYKYINIAHGKNGVWSNLDVSFADFIITFIPCLNIIYVLCWVFYYPYKHKSLNFNKLFKVSK